jgi:predicted Zn-dependent protease
MISTERAYELAAALLEAARAAGSDQAEALVVASDDALTRFAGNRIHQNVASTDTELQLRAVVGSQVGVASTNATDAAGIEACAASALDAARRAPADPGFPGLPGPHPVAPADRVSAATLAFDASGRAGAAAALIEPTFHAGGVAAGGVACQHSLVAIANSLGVSVAMPRTSVRATVLSTGVAGGTGWASFTNKDAATLDAAGLGAFAAATARRSADAIDLSPGDYTVLLAPEAVADIAQFLAWYGCSAKSVEEGRSFMSGRIGQRVVSDLITLVDDALGPESMGLTFDYEGQPKQRVVLLDRGTVVGPVTDSYWAAKTRRPNTGHALPAPNSEGPLPLDVEMAAGDAEPAAMIASVKRGIYVTRFHYVNIEDPSRQTLTGMTRDGTFLIEDGELTRPVRDLRFTQSSIDALSTTLAVSRERALVGEEAPVLVPYLLLEKFAVTGQKSRQ